MFCINTDFNQLLNQFSSRCPTQKRGDVTVVFVKDHPVVLQVGEMLGIHWVDIQIELPRYRADNINTAQKLLSANREIAAATPIPSWFACGDKGEVLFFNRLDWQHVTVETLEDHIINCIDQMNDALIIESA